MIRRTVRVNARDNVAIVVDPEGARAGDAFAAGVQAREAIPQSHKAALIPFAAGDPVIRYGQIIGYARSAIPAGAWVREDLLTQPLAPPLDRLALATETPLPLPPLANVFFDGYRNADGTSGTRNLLGLATTVQCVAPTVDHAAARIRRELLPRFPHVDGVVSLTHGYGCGVAIDAPGAAIPIATLKHIGLHANIGCQPLIIGLGCEKLQPARLFGPELSIMGQANIVRLQDRLGFAASVSTIMEAAERQLAILDRKRRVPCPASTLIVGLQCGGSDAFSGVTCNPAVGFAADLLVRAGATVLFSEVTEVRDAVHLLTPRCATPDVANALIREMRWYDEYLARGGADRAANPTPGNKRGGLSNIVEKSLGSIAKAGTTALQLVATHGERVRGGQGLVFAATPASDFICGTQQLASMNVHVFTTGEGTPYGLAMVPVVKVSSRTSLAERWHDLIDIDAGPIATGTASIEDVGREIFQFILDTASGRRKTWAEHWNLANALVPFAPGPVT